jgi:hypothetical protein
MPRFLLIAVNNPTPGDDDVYNAWYNKTHKADLMSVDGAQSVRRFKVVQRNRIDKDYVSITEIEGESAEAVMAELARKSSNFEGSHLDRTTSIFMLAEEMDTNA